MTIASRRTLTEIVSATLEQIPTRFGRLLYVARSWSPDSRRYEHHGWMLTHDVDKVHRTLATAHLREWEAWLAMSVEQQHADLEAHLQGLDRAQVLRRWATAEPWHQLAPWHAQEAQRRLFAADFRNVLAVLKRAG